MPAPIPHTSPPTWPDPVPSSRFASLIRRDSPAGCRIGLIGLADDLGIKLNGGRPGAKAGPAAFRAALARYGVADPYGWEWPAVFDAGDITPAAGDTEAALHETHRRVTQAVTAILDLGLLPVGIGGGHDLTFPFVRAAASRFPIKSGEYHDAHLDVRPTAGSGMPFRRLIEDCGVEHLVAHWPNLLANSREHIEWFLAHGGRIEGTCESWDHVQSAEGPPDADRFISIDLDCLDMSLAPGVSAPRPGGIKTVHLEFAAQGAGRDKRVRCFDIMELSPPHDESGRTARIAAHLFLSFLRGIAERPQ